MERSFERLFGWVFAMLGVECSTEVIANVCSNECSVRFAHTAHASLMGAYAPKRSANRAWSWKASV